MGRVSKYYDGMMKVFTAHRDGDGSNAPDPDCPCHACVWGRAQIEAAKLRVYTGPIKTPKTVQGMIKAAQRERKRERKQRGNKELGI